jgi:Gas vesicle synthesis protein GvpL/GvpF
MARTEAEQQQLLRRLRAALELLSPEDVAKLIDEAQAEARAEVKRLLTGLMTESMLAQVEQELQPKHLIPQPPAKQRPAEKRPDPAPRPNSPRPNPSPATQEVGVYVYGVVPADAELPSGLSGVEPTNPPALLRHGDVAAVVSKVSLNEFEEERLREHLSDMDWVEATARAHELVLEMVGAVTTLIPMRMCSVYRTEGGVKEMLARESTPLLDALERLKGKTEWGVKVFADEQPTGAAGAAEEAQSGTDYMRQRKSERDARFIADERLQEACAAIHDQLSAAAVDSLTAPLQRPEVSGHEGQMLLNGVYLVASDQQQAFLGLVQQLRHEHEPSGLYLEPTGPWPAYNFVPGTIGAAW